MVFLVSNFILKHLTHFLSRSRELLFLFTLAWGFGIASMFYKFGFSVEVGALLAGVSLATMPYAQDVGSLVSPFLGRPLLFGLNFSFSTFTCCYRDWETREPKIGRAHV